MKKQYLIYADESHRKGDFFSNFYGGALVDYGQLQRINSLISKKKQALGLFREVKWTRVTPQYLDKYIELINYFFLSVKRNDIKIRIMFRQNALVPKKLTKMQLNNEYFLLYYQFIKHSFGLDYCNIDYEKNNVFIKLYFDKLPDTKKNNSLFKNYIYSLNNFININNVYILEEDITEVDSKQHLILQCMDIILGSMNFRLNDLHKQKNPLTNRRGKRTIAKEKLYKTILKNIREIYPNFNVGISTSAKGKLENYWLHPYRHWCFRPKYSSFDSNLTKK